MFKAIKKIRLLNSIHWVLALIIVLPFFYWLKRYINLDFWYDEMFTLTNYVFCPISKTITDYSFPNNHIFFNIINNIYLKILGVKDIYQLLDAPYKIRMLSLIYSLVTLIYLYLIGKRYFNPFVALLALLIATTSISYYNFALQVRGFSLSIMLLTMLIYYTLGYEKEPNFKNGLAILLLTALSLYTIPSNLYFILGMAGYYFFSLLFKSKKDLKEKRGKNKKALKKTEKVKIVSQPVGRFYSRGQIWLLLLIFGAGIILSIIFYSPVLKDVLTNRFVQSQGLFYFSTLVKTMPEVFGHFLSGRYLFIPLIGAGLVFYFKRKQRTAGGRLDFWLFLLISPFVFSFIRGDRPYLRVFLFLIPAFAFFLACLIEIALAKIPKLILAVLLLSVYTHITFAFQIKHIESRLRSAILEGKRAQDLNYNYYQANYQPYKLLKDFKEIYNNEPVFLYDYDYAALPVYLEKFGIKVRGDISRQPSDFKETILQKEKGYVITAARPNFLRIIKTHFPNFKATTVNENLDFHTIFLIERTDDKKR